MNAVGEFTQLIMDVARFNGAPLTETDSPTLFAYYTENMADSGENLPLGTVIGRHALTTSTCENTQTEIELSHLNESFGLMQHTEVCMGQEFGWIDMSFRVAKPDQQHSEDEEAPKDPTVIPITLCTCGEVHIDELQTPYSPDNVKNVFDSLGLTALGDLLSGEDYDPVLKHYLHVKGLGAGHFMELGNLITKCFSSATQ